ncbi:SUMF1/EgtB/PvdO family nonheme iron enzyme [Streptomyces sp. MST-110588]|uniref:formylglycine-generating enzyme family protein n=1 Tax=Streptomyces sp. MST-110588 TaxID=2833628 RepID=UPI001F5D8E75|nr:SUMF1/EgtB/PvdO family nonheme iron enzyme [Streptomyces sp. MST-110588]UNO38722.1 SUMF1/EgtB/PvdO family nonheme iron enzyme [Streptomyces sp. MST-110588]
MTDLHMKEEADLERVCSASRQHLLLGRRPEELVAIAEGPNAPTAERVTAGAMLALFGDPRTPAVPTLARVPGGRVEIGLPPAAVTEVAARWKHVGVLAEWIEKETPVHSVVLRTFWIGTYPVTNSQYVEFLLDSHHPHRPSTWYLGAYPWDRANHPVCGVRAEDADAYAAWLTAHTGHPYRLPTEAEWEHAAKGFAGTEYPWGDTFDPQRANTRETRIHTTTPVGVFPGGDSPFGISDMAGNVEEYTADDYQPYPDGRRVGDHLDQLLGTYRVTRGGSFARYGDLARTRRRHGAHPGPLYPCGLRIASSSPPPT